MSIFILEDDVIQAQNLKRIVKEITEKHQIKYDFIEATSRESQIIEKLSMLYYLPIYFLDIEIKGEKKKGLQVAQQIRKYDQNGIIVFITTHSEFAPISYEYMVSAFTFINKSLPFEQRYKLIEDCLLHYKKRNEMSVPDDNFIIENNYTTIRVPFETVQYIMTDEPHRLALVTTNRLIYFYGTLKEIEVIDDRLLRCHQSYLVNRDKVSAYDGNNRQLILKSGEIIPVSRRLAKKVRLVVRGDY